MKKLKLLVIAVTVLLLALFMFSCEQASAGEKEGDEKTPAKDKIEMAEGEETTVKDDETTSAETTGEKIGSDSKETEKEVADTTAPSSFETEMKIETQAESDITPTSPPKKSEDTTAVKDPVKTPETKPAETTPNTDPLDALLDKIAEDYYNYLVEYYKFNKENGGAIYVEKYYGTYDGAVPVIIDGTQMTHSAIRCEEKVAGFVFEYSSSNKIKVWKNGDFYSLQEAYDKGILSKDQIAEIYEFDSVEFKIMEHGYPN